MFMLHFMIGPIHVEKNVTLLSAYFDLLVEVTWTRVHLINTYPSNYVMCLALDHLLIQ